MKLNHFVCAIIFFYYAKRRIFSVNKISNNLCIAQGNLTGNAIVPIGALRLALTRSFGSLQHFKSQLIYHNRLRLITMNQKINECLQAHSDNRAKQWYPFSMPVWTNYGGTFNFLTIFIAQAYIIAFLANVAIPWRRVIIWDTSTVFTTIIHSLKEM